jgi:DNA-binding HxlR family transcriptional regulator
MVRDAAAVDEVTSFCPLVLTTDVIGDRWTPLILRELSLGNTRFNDIARGLTGVSRSLLVQRLKHLERKGVVEISPLPGGRGNEYFLTPAGADLVPVLIAMGRWSVAWMYHRLDPTDVDAEGLMWWMHRRVDIDRLPVDRVVVQFDHTAPMRRSYWMLFERQTASVCMADPGFPVDAVVTCPTLQLARVFSGFQTWASAVRSDAIHVHGSRKVVAELPKWFAWSPWADEVLDQTRRAAVRPSTV